MSGERTYRCGACGTEASGFRTDMMLSGFADDHARLCPGLPPATESAPQRTTPECTCRYGNTDFSQAVSIVEDCPAHRAVLRPPTPEGGAGE